MPPDEEVINETVVATPDVVATADTSVDVVDAGDTSPVQANVWEEIAGEMEADDVGIDEVEETVEAPVEEQPAEPIAPIEQAPVAQESQVAPSEVAKTPEQLAVEQAAKEAAAATPPPEAVPQQQTPEHYAKVMKETEEKLVQHYQISDEHKQQLRENPEALFELLPKMAATIAMDLQQAFTMQANRAVPAMIHQYQTRNSQVKQNEDSFFTKWPQLSKPEFRDTIVRLGKAYRSVNPKASAEQFIQDVGVQAMMAHQLQFPGTGQVEEIVVTPPHVPPRGSSLAPVSRQQSDNAFAQLAEEFLTED